MNPDQLRQMLEARYKARVDGRQLSEEERNRIWNQTADEVDAHAERMQRTAGGLARVAPQFGDSTNVLRQLFAAHPDSAAALAGEFEASQRPQATARDSVPAPRPYRPPAQEKGLTYAEQALLGLQQGGRDFVGRNAFGLTRLADNVTGGRIGPLNRAADRTREIQDEWNREEEMLRPQRGAIGGAARLLGNFAGEGATFMLGGKALGAASPTYKRMFDLGNAGGKGSMAARVISGAPINAAQTMLDWGGNDYTLPQAALWNMGLGVVGDAAFQPILQAAARVPGAGMRQLRRAFGMEPAGIGPSGRPADAPEIEKYIEMFQPNTPRSTP